MPRLGVQPPGPTKKAGPPTQVRGPKEKTAGINGHVARRLDKGGINGRDKPGGKSDG